jgi:plasmid stabilization system protein ParE
VRVRYLEAAVDDLRQAIEYYGRLSPTAAQGFRDEYRSAMARIEAYPLAWQMVVDDFRQHRLRRFPFAVVYRVFEDHILIVAVANLHRQPGGWRSRVR